jgi:hypothetical protein
LVSLTVLATLAGCKKKGPMVVLASCELREGARPDESQICMDVGDKGFIPKARAICDDDPSRTRWHDGVQCDRSGALGGCRSSGGIMWYFPSAKHKSAADVQHACKSSSDKYVTLEEETPPAGSSSASVAGGSAKGPGTSPAVTMPPGSMAGALDVGAFLGTRADGWTPKALGPLRKGLTRPQVAKLFPGADKVDHSEVSEVRIKDVKGIVLYRFHFNDNHLFEVDVHFEPSLHNAPFRETLLKAGSAKWGPPKENTADRIRWQSADIRDITFEDAFETPPSYRLEVEL